MEQLKQLCRPMIKAMQGVGSTASSSSSPPPMASPPMTPQKTVGPVASPSSSAASPGVTFQDIHTLMAQQDQKYQAMMSQVLQHVMTISPGAPQTFNIGDQQMSGGYSPDKVSRMNADYYDYMEEVSGVPKRIREENR